METKQCSKCKNIIALKFFSKNGPRLKSACKSCTSNERKRKLSLLPDYELKAFIRKQSDIAFQYGKNVAHYRYVMETLI